MGKGGVTVGHGRPRWQKLGTMGNGTVTAMGQKRKRLTVFYDREFIAGRECAGFFLCWISWIYLSYDIF